MRLLLRKQHECDFDVRENLTAQEFLVEYLSIDKPVLVRNATAGRYHFVSFACVFNFILF